MRLRFRAGGGAIACIARIHAGASIELADSANAFDNFFGTKSTILVIKTVPGSIGGEHIKLHQMDVLAHNIRRSAHLEIVLRINTRDEIGYLDRYEVVSFGPEKKRFRRVGAVEGRFYVGP